MTWHAPPPRRGPGCAGEEIARRPPSLPRTRTPDERRLALGELDPYDALIGTWTVQMTHPAIDGTMRGEVTFEWLAGEAFLLQRSSTDHPEVPESLWVLGRGPDGLQVDYYDSRGVRRVYAVSLRAGQLRLWRAVPGLSQRFLGTIAASGDEIDGLWQVSRDDATWDDDLRVRYLRR